MASGTLADLVTAQLKGWEIVLDGLAAAAVDRRIRASRAVTTHRPRTATPSTPCPPRIRCGWRAMLAGAGGRLVSITQVHDTLEDLFVRQVDQASGTDRFAAGAAGGGGRCAR